MAERDVVRITFKEIQSIAETSKEGEQEEDGKEGEGGKRRRRAKRPELAIYRPGQLRISKKKEGGRRRDEGGGGRVEEEEEEEWGGEGERVKGACGTTEDEDSSRGSKENSVDKEVAGGSCQDTSPFTPSPAPHREKGEGGGRRRSKRPDIQIYVPKGRHHRGEEEETDTGFPGQGGGAEASSGSVAEPECADLAAGLASLKVWGEEGRASPAHTHHQQKPGSTSVAWDGAGEEPGHSSRHTPDDGHQDSRQREEGGHRPQQSAEGAGGKRAVNREGGQWDGTCAEREWRGAGRHSEDRDSTHKGGEQVGGRGRGPAAFRDQRPGRHRGQDDTRDPRPGRGRGRSRHMHYNRSSSSESLTKSVDLGQRGHWPAERMPQHGGTFPRSKATRHRPATADSREGDEMAEWGQGQAGSKYTFSSMRPPRERSGSISSDTSGGSDLSWEDLEAEFEREKPDWNTQVEQYLEEVARQVQDSTQRLTDSIDSSFHTHPPAASTTPPAKHLTSQPGLTRTLSASSDHIFTQEYRGRKKDRRRKGSRSKNSSRDSSLHSNPHDDGLWPAPEGKQRSHRRRHRRRPSSAGPGGRVGTVEGQRAAESLRIMVGKNRERRQVMVEGKGGEGEGGRCRHHSGGSSSEAQRGRNQQYERSPRERRGGAGGGGGGEGGRGAAGRKGGEQQGQGQREDRRWQGGGGGQSGGDGSQWRDGGRRRGGGGGQQTQSAPSPGGTDPYGQSPRSAPSPTAPSPSTHTAGLIKLPSEHPGPDRPHHLMRSQHGQGRGQGQWCPGQVVDGEQASGQDERFRGRGCGGVSSLGPGGQGERRLFDPKNPSKPIRVPDPRPLHFLDPEEPSHSPSSPHHHHDAPPTFPPSSPLSHSAGPVGSPGMAPSFPPFFPPHPGYMYPPPPHMALPFPPYTQGPPPPGHPIFYGFQPARPLGEPDEAYFNRETEQMVTGMSRPQCRLMAEQVLRDTAPLDCQLANILSRGPLTHDAHRRLKQLRQELQRRYERVLLLDMDVANQRGVEQQLWRSVYYNVIEGLRRQTHDNSTTEGAGPADTKAALNEILDEGTSFYEALLTKLQSTFSFSLDSLLEEGGCGGPHTEGAGRGVRLAVLSAQRTLMFLGDLARYREQAAHSSNYGKARHWYMQAQKLAPKNGRPYNQLAILAVYTRRKLDAVYYYQRSLAASNPILTARESLMSLFDEVRRKEEAVEQRRVEEARRKRRRRAPPSQPHPHARRRVEVWIAADGSRSQDRQSDRDSDPDDLTALSATELNKRFLQTFLNVHGKLFTKINFEVFTESGSVMLQEWRLLLQHSPCLLSAARLVQLMAINMFSIDNTALKDESLGASCRSLLQEHAVEVALDMFGLLASRVRQLLGGQGAQEGGDQGPLGEDLRQLLPGLKVWVDWMMCHSSLWNPQPSLRPPDVGPQVDVWQSVADLCNTLKQVSTTHVTLHRNKEAGCQPLVLMEDSMMAGFVPLLSAPVDAVYVSGDQDKEVAMDCLRLEKLVLFGEYLCGIEPPMLSFDVQTGRYFSVAPAPVKSEETLTHPGEEVGGELSEDVIVESEESGEDGDETPGETIKELKARKAELRQRVEDQARNKHNLQTLVEQSCGSRLELEVRPRFLVTDTNCFIDHLPSLRSLLATATYTLVVPLVVVNELDGLAKGATNQGQGHHDHSPEHVAMVTRHANQALTYLESEVKAKNPQVRVQTSRGSVLETLAFRSEESDNTGNNDDLILSCCLHYCRDMARDFMPKDKDSPVRLFRDVVLLTDDRNLRLKAHTSNVPAKDMPAFCRWSKVT
ncbi:telomerase-binding protein EST1A-like [Babylonia areolata]|uniref:telomerase-binding protein EST1A-like n=1 Tax=Babylonia areolata TaxID=304850 RepID=UPI003FD2B48D